MDTITTADGRDIPITGDAAEADAYATALTVNYSGKVNLGNYENAEPFASVRAELRPAVRVEGNVEGLQRHAGNLHRVVDHHVRQAIAEAEEDRT